MTKKSYTQAELNGQIHNAVSSVLTGMRTNAVDMTIRSRLAAALSGGYDWADTLHNIYLDYGYPVSLDFFNFWSMYRRFGIARRAVELYSDQTWMDDPIIEGDERMLRDLDALNRSLGLWRRLKGLDTRQRVGRYAGLFMRVRDGKTPDQPIDGTLPGLGALVDMVPMYEGQLQVTSTQGDPMADDYGQPTMYQYNAGAVGGRNEKASSAFPIHPSRIVIAAEDSDNSGIYGIPALECVYNSLMDLRKVLGGGAEGFYKNAAQNVVFDLKDGASASANATLLNRFNEEYDEFAKNRFRRAMWSPGMEPRVLDSTMVQPKEFADALVQDIAAGVNIPAALLVGNQTGRLAGDQDTKGFLAQVQARRLDFGTDLVRAAIDWLMKYGILPRGSYEVEWPDAMAPSADEKLANADKMADIDKKIYESGGVVPFTGEEIREAAGYEPVEELDELPDETLDDEELDE